MNNQLVELNADFSNDKIGDLKQRAYPDNFKQGHIIKLLFRGRLLKDNDTLTDSSK